MLPPGSKVLNYTDSTARAKSSLAEASSARYDVVPAAEYGRTSVDVPPSLANKSCATGPSDAHACASANAGLASRTAPVLLLAKSRHLIGPRRDACLGRGATARIVRPQTAAFTGRKRASDASEHGRVVVVRRRHVGPGRRRGRFRSKGEPSLVYQGSGAPSEKKPPVGPSSVAVASQTGASAPSVMLHVASAPTKSIRTREPGLKMTAFSARNNIDARPYIL